MEPGGLCCFGHSTAQKGDISRYPTPVLNHSHVSLYLLIFFVGQLLESSKLRLEMLLEQQRKEARLEAAARDDEMEETRANAAKKLKSELYYYFYYVRLSGLCQADHPRTV